MLTYETAKHCHTLIQESEQTALRRELIKKALEYSRIRAQWMVMTLDQRKEEDQRRTLAHNSFIGVCNILDRNMGTRDEDNAWRADLGEHR